MKITSKFLIIFALMCVCTSVAFSQDCSSYKLRAEELASKGDYCQAKQYYLMYQNCNADVDVSTEIAMCERYCKLQNREIKIDNTKSDSNTDYVPIPSKPDIITLNDGSEIKAKVTEVGTNDIKYTRYGTSLPTYTLQKSEIFMIVYENGVKDVFNKMPMTPTPSIQPVTPTEIIGSGTQYLNSNLTEYKYSFGKTINPVGGKKSPFLAGFLSFLIPGVGQFYTGDIAGGFLYMGSNIICNSVWMSTGDDTVFTVGLLCALTIEISSIIQAASTAQKVNIARGYYLGNNAYLNLNPTLIKTNDFAQQNLKNSACGISFKISF